MPDDTDEVAVLTSIVRKLDALPPDARKRLLRYLTDRFDPFEPLPETDRGAGA